MNKKATSFTLSELLVVMIITAIVVGLAFSVLRLVQKQIVVIQKNYQKSTDLSLFEQRIWQDFNELNMIQFDQKENKLTLLSEVDTVVYFFQDDFVLRNRDTTKLKLRVDKMFFEKEKVANGLIDAISISGEAVLPKYKIFVFKKNDLTRSINQEDGF